VKRIIGMAISACQYFHVKFVKNYYENFKDNFWEELDFLIKFCESELKDKKTMNKLKEI
jgi:hypothetical protein